MNAFITLGNAARLLAAHGDSSENVALWQSLLESQADELNAVKSWASCASGSLPGGISYWRSPLQWQIPRAQFLAWCEKHKYRLGFEEVKSRATCDGKTKGTDAGRRGKQVAAIMDAIRRQGWDAMRIPPGGKGRIKSICLTEAKLFTDTGFARGWQAAINGGLLRMENHDTYSRR